METASYMVYVGSHYAGRFVDEADAEYFADMLIAKRTDPNGENARVVLDLTVRDNG